MRDVKSEGSPIGVGHWLRVAAMGAALSLVGVTSATAQHDHMLIGSTTPGGGSVILQYDFTRLTVLAPPTFAGIDPSFAPLLFDDPAVPIHPLLQGTTVRVEVVALDAGASLTVDGTRLDRPGDRKRLGSAPDLHNHVTWSLEVPDGVVGDFLVSFKLLASGQYADSPVYTITLTNRAIVTTTTTSTTTSTTTTIPPAGIDDQLCYRAPLARGEPRIDMQRRTLTDRLGGAQEADVRSVSGVCNPAWRDDTPPTHPAVGLEQFAIQPAKGAPALATQAVTVRDAFGASYSLLLVKPDRLLVPGGMAAAGSPVVIPPDATSGTPGAVHHLQCYRAKTPKGMATPPSRPTLTASDRFGTLMLDLIKPTSLCVPVDAGGDPAATGAADGLVCWQARVTRHTPKPERRLDARSSLAFGEHQVDVKSVAELCVTADTVP